MFCCCKLLILPLKPYCPTYCWKYTHVESSLCVSSVVVLLMSNSNLGLEHAHFRERNVSALEVVVVLKRSPSRSKVVVRRTMSLFEAREFLSHLHLGLHHSSEVPSREDAIVGNGVIQSMRLVIVQVLEVASIRVAKVEGKEGVSVIDSVQFLAIHELLNILLDNRSLVYSSSLGSSCVDSNAISEGEDVLITLVLEGVGIDINDTFGICDARGDKLLVGLARRVDHTCEEILLDNLA